MTEKSQTNNKEKIDTFFFWDPHYTDTFIIEYSD